MKGRSGFYAQKHTVVRYAVDRSAGTGVVIRVLPDRAGFVVRDSETGAEVTATADQITYEPRRVRRAPPHPR